MNIGSVLIQTCKIPISDLDQSCCTRKNAQIVTNLKTNCNQLNLQTSSQAVDKLGSQQKVLPTKGSAKKIITINYDITILSQSYAVNFVTLVLQLLCVSELLGQSCNTCCIPVKLTSLKKLL